MRLRGGRTPNEGRVEIFINGQWGTICHDMFDINDARLFCRLLGYGNASLAVLGSTFGQGSGPVWLDDLQCAGTEPSFFQCQHLSFGRHNCHGHLGDAGVMCGSESKLTQGNSQSIFLASSACSIHRKELAYSAYYKRARTV